MKLQFDTTAKTIKIEEAVNLGELMEKLEIIEYEYNFFRNDFQDNVHGVWLDITLQVDTDCYELPNYEFTNLTYTIENGVYIKK